MRQKKNIKNSLPAVNDNVTEQEQLRAAAILAGGNTTWDYVVRIAQLEVLLAKATGKDFSVEKGVESA